MKQHRIRHDVFLAALKVFRREAATKFESGCCAVVDDISDKQSETRCRQNIEEVFDDDYVRGLMDGFDGARLHGPRYKQGIVDGIAIAKESIKRGTCDDVSSVIWQVLALMSRVLKGFSVEGWDGRAASFLLEADRTGLRV